MEDQYGDFKVGDIVQLKSGGPKMTVGEKPYLMKSHRGVYCQWFSGSKLASGFFDAQALQPSHVEKKEEG